MAIGDNSYGSVAEVVALTRIYLRGESTFSASTRPTLTEVEQFIDRASGILNLALAAKGFTVPIAQADAKLACDDWVVSMAAAYVEKSQPTSRTGSEENPRTSMFLRMHKEAEAFVEKNSAGFAHLGASQPKNDANALQFTGYDAPSQRSDPDNTSIAQPHFSRGQFDS